MRCVCARGSVVCHFYLEATVWYSGFDLFCFIDTQDTSTQETFDKKPHSQCHENKIGYRVRGPKRNGIMSIDDELLQEACTERRDPLCTGSCI